MVWLMHPLDRGGVSPKWLNVSHKGLLICILQQSQIKQHLLHRTPLRRVQFADELHQRCRTWRRVRGQWFGLLDIRSWRVSRVRWQRIRKLKRRWVEMKSCDWRDLQKYFLGMVRDTHPSIGWFLIPNKSLDWVRRYLVTPAMVGARREDLHNQFQSNETLLCSCCYRHWRIIHFSCTGFCSDICQWLYTK